VLDRFDDRLQAGPAKVSLLVLSTFDTGSTYDIGFIKTNEFVS
jgi:hypothetical protein